ncbi:uncharacterized protein LOC115576593 [Sparus aurata]|uniref:uncharacterized protein LOC115576593 n=1 Tax=Sparus aurata TaxID=8175 RepID=UPI0011C136DB|nr:uncharacterized protein LOC115576593 [Sparus aurata]
MGRWKLWLVLLLPLTFQTNSQDTKQLLVKTIGSKPDITPICTDETQNPIVFIVCKIRTVRSVEECHLLYREQNFVNECDSRFRLLKENQTVFLHLTSLKSVDSGNYICDCSRSFGTSMLQMHVTVEEDEDNSSSTREPILSVFVGVTAVVTIAAVILGCIHMTKSNGDCSRTASSALYVRETHGSVAEDHPYTSLQHPASDLHQTDSYSASNKVTVGFDTQ